MITKLLSIVQHCRTHKNEKSKASSISIFCRNMELKTGRHRQRKLTSLLQRSRKWKMGGKQDTSFSVIGLLVFNFVNPVNAFLQIKEP